MKVPLGVSRSYAELVNAWLDQFQAFIFETVLTGWGRNPVAFGSHNRHDSDFVNRRIAGIKIALEHKFAPDKLTPQIRKFSQRVETKNGEEFHRVIGIPAPNAGIKSQLDTFQDQNVALIKSLASDQIQDVRTLLEQAEVSAWRVEELRAKIQDRFDVAKSKADLIARDQVLKLNSQLTKTRQTNAGITRYIWTTSKDERVRPAHQDLEGTVQAWSDPPVVDDDGRTANPGEDYQCRCTAYPILDDVVDANEPSRVPEVTGDSVDAMIRLARKCKTPGVTFLARGRVIR